MSLLIAHTASQQAFSWQTGGAVTAGQFLNQAQHLAQALPQAKYLFNACANRYHFAVTLAAALLRGQICLLPASHTPNMIAMLADKYPTLYCVTDEIDCAIALPLFQLPDLPSDTPAIYSVPGIPDAQVAAIVFTSGSTGEPTANLKTWGKLVINAQAEGRRLGITPQHCLVGTVPAQHMYGFESTVLMALHTGCTFHAGKPFFPADVVQALSQVPAPRTLVTTPFHLRTVVDSGLKLIDLDCVVCATAPLSVELASLAEQFTKAPLVEIYGCTESGQLATRRSTHTQRWQTFDGASLHQSKEVTYASGSYIEGEVALSDIIELHSTTQFSLVGRHADMVNIAGKRSSLQYLNQQLLAVAGVEDGAFFAPQADVPDAVQRLAICLVAPTHTKNSVLAALRERVDAVFLPRHVYFLDALPRNATGKLTANALQKLVSGGIHD